MSEGKKPFSSVLWISQVLFAKGRKRAKKADFGRFPRRAARHPLSPHLLHPHLRQPNSKLFQVKGGPPECQRRRDDNKNKICAFEGGGPWGRGRRVPNGVFQMVFFRFLTSPCDRRKPLQRDKTCLKTPVF